MAENHNKEKGLPGESTKPKNPGVAEKRRKSFSGKLVKAFRDVATSPAFWIPLGNACLAFLTAEPIGITVSIALVALSAGAKAYSSWTDQASGLPFWLLAGKNYFVAGSVAMNALEKFGLQNIFNFSSGDVLMSWTAALSFAGWATGHVFAGFIDKKLQDQRINSPKMEKGRDISYGLADLAAVKGDPVATVMFSIGLYRALRKKDRESNKAEGGDLPSAASIIDAQATPSRFYGLGYFAGALMNMGNPVLTAAMLSWGVGYLMMEPEKNATLLSDFKNIFGVETDLQADLIPAMESMLTKTLAKNSDYLTHEMWSEASAAIASFYSNIPEDMKTQKDSAFALLEIMSAKFPSKGTIVAHNKIIDMAAAGEVRAKERLERQSYHAVDDNNVPDDNYPAAANIKKAADMLDKLGFPSTNRPPDSSRTIYPAAAFAGPQVHP